MQVPFQYRLVNFSVFYITKTKSNPDRFSPKDTMNVVQIWRPVFKESQSSPWLFSMLPLIVQSQAWSPGEDCDESSDLACISGDTGSDLTLRLRVVK